MMSSESIVAVTWDDAHVEPTALMTTEELAASTLVQFVTFGIIVRDDDKVVAIAAELTEAGYRGVTMIPRGMVRDVTSIGTWPPRKRRASVARQAPVHQRASAIPETVPQAAPKA